MIYRTLGRTGLNVSLVSLGTGGPSNLGQAAGVPEVEAHRLLRQALDLGVNFIDTSAVYRDSEAIIGRALRGIPVDRWIIATKFPPQDGDRPKSDPQALVESVERSLARLGRDRIDVMQLHGVIPATYRQVTETFYPTLLKLREQGKIQFIGITERFFSDPRHEMLAMALADDLWDTVMLKYGILNMVAERELLPLCQRQNVGVLNMASVRVKLTRPDQLAELLRDWQARGLIPGDGLPENDPLGWLVHGEVDSVVAAGYKFAAAHPAISTVITGTANPAHLKVNVGAVLGGPLPEADVNRLRGLFGRLAEAV